MSSRVSIGIGVGWIAIVGIAIAGVAIAWVAIAGVVRPIHLYLIRVFISYIRIYLYDSV